MKNIFQAIVSIVLLVVVSACANGPYEEGKSPNDVPARVNTVLMKKIYIALNDNSKDANGDAAEDTTPSQNDQEVLKVAKSSIINQFTNYGYKVIEGDKGRADIAAKFFVYYQPELGPIVGRGAAVFIRAYDMDGQPLFRAGSQSHNSFGLIGAALGPDRDNFVAETARNATINFVNEMRKGTKEKK